MLELETSRHELDVSRLDTKQALHISMKFGHELTTLEKQIMLRDRMLEDCRQLLRKNKRPEAEPSEMPGYKALSELQSLFPRGLSKAKSEASFESLPRMGSRRVRKGSAKKRHSTGSDEDRTPVNRRKVAEKANADIHLGRRAAPRRKVTRGSPTKEEPRDRRASLPSDEERKSALAVPFFSSFFSCKV
jgi:hypothetical protein